MSSYDPESDLFTKGKEFLSMFNKVAEFTKEILLENERLQNEVHQIEQENRRLHQKETPQHSGNGEIAALLEEKKRLELEKGQLLEKFQQVEEENKDFVSRYLEIEEENNNMANLYVASYQLHSTLDFHEVVSIIMEIIINLIGAEVFGLLLLDEKTGAISAVAMEGFDVDTFPQMKRGVGTIGRCLETGESYFYEGGSNIEGEPNPHHPIVCVPLTIKDRVIGAVVIYRLLQQKDQFTNVDYELFNLLAGHAATALFSAKLYSESERKLHTIQGFIDLLTK